MTYTYEGIEVEVDPTVVPEGYSDAEVAHEARQDNPNRGGRRAASYLIEVPAFARPAVMREARIQSNMCGGRYADAVWTRARDWRSAVRVGAEATAYALARS